LVTTLSPSAAGADMSEGDLRQTEGAGRLSAAGTCSKVAGTRDKPCAEPGAHLHAAPLCRRCVHSCSNLAAVLDAQRQEDKGS
jgi:hypothetical protein